MLGKWLQNLALTVGDALGRTPLGAALGELDVRQRRVLSASFVLIALLLGLSSLRQQGCAEEDVEVLSEEEIALQEAMAAVDLARALAQEAIVPSGDEWAQEIVAEDAALRSNWTKGQAMTLQGVVSKNETVSVSLQKRQIPQAAIHTIVEATGREFNFRKARPGDRWTAELTEDGTITRFRYQQSLTDIWNTLRQDDGQYTCQKEHVQVETREEVIAGVIRSSFWAALDQAGERGALAHRFMDVFAYTIDFNTETQTGDRFAMVFEKQYIEGKFLRYGRLIAAQYVGQAGVFSAFLRPGDKDAQTYYDLDGESLQRQFLRSPLPFTRVTSNFGRRFHPILKEMKMHAGVDYGAPVGTPVQAVADASVTHAGWRGAYGKLVVLRHAGGYETEYAHLSAISVRQGQRVSRGAVIGRVGNTGRSTGPHLHFGMRQNGRFINPLQVQFTRGEPLRGKAREDFARAVAKPLSERLFLALEAQEKGLAPVRSAEQPSISATEPPSATPR